MLCQSDKTKCLQFEFQLSASNFSLRKINALKMPSLTSFVYFFFLCCFRDLGCVTSKAISESLASLFSSVFDPGFDGLRWEIFVCHLSNMLHIYRWNLEAFGSFWMKQIYGYFPPSLNWLGWKISVRFASLNSHLEDCRGLGKQFWTSPLWWVSSWKYLRDLRA